MMRLLRVFLLIAICVPTVVLTLTAAPTLASGEMHGQTLLMHMGASGAFVFVLPVVAIAFFASVAGSQFSGRLWRGGYWATIVLGLLTIATVFLCMFPLAATEQMESLVLWHGYFGFGFIPALVLFVLGFATKKAN